MYDVVIIGYGPTGMLAAVKLGRAGVKVAVIERYKSLYMLPRVGIVHDDVMRMFQEIGIQEKVKPATQFLPIYEMINNGKILLSNDVEPYASHGWPEFISIYQPAFEAELDNVVKTLPTVDLFRGEKAVAIEQDKEKVSVTVEEDGGAKRKIEGRYLIAADGGNSFARPALGLEYEFLGFDQDWLVIDAKIKRPKPNMPPLRQFCEPQQPGMTMQMGANHRRWSFMIFEGETIENAMKPENVWKRLDRPEGGTSDDFELIRVASYKFTSQLAKSWQVGRVFLAGDAAHLMPPFLAQGMCSGFRDAYNIAWKLELVVKGLAGPEILKSYEQERSPNAKATIIESARVGQNVVERDPEKAKARDAQLAVMQAQLEKARKENSGQKALIAFRVPGFTEGVIAKPGGKVKGAGDVFPQGKVRNSSAEGPFDDIAGRGFLILSRHGNPFAALSGEDRAFWNSLGGGFASIGKDGLTDLEGRYTKLMDEYGCDVIVKRPDYYIFGACPAVADLPAMIDDLRSQLRAGLN